MSLAVSGLIALPLFLSAVGKFAHPVAFERALDNYTFLTEPSREAARRFVAPMEVIFGAAVLVSGDAYAPIPAAALYATFAGLLILAWVRGNRGACGCFVALHSRIGPVSVIRALILASAASALVALRATGVLPPVSILEGLLAAIVLIVLCAMAAACWDLLAGSVSDSREL